LKTFQDHVEKRIREMKEREKKFKKDKIVEKELK